MLTSYEIISCTRHCDIATERNTRVWPPNLPDLNPVDYSVLGIFQQRVYHSRIHDVKELKERLLREWKLMDHSIIAAAIAQWCSHLSACVRVDGGHSERKFLTCDSLMCFIHFINTGLRKFDLYKHITNTCKVLRNIS